MADPAFIDELTERLRHSQRMALLPVFAGVGVAALWVGLSREFGLWPLGWLALGAVATAALTWLQGRLIDLRFLPTIVAMRGFHAQVSGACLLARLPGGVVTMGSRQVVQNPVSGRAAGWDWQAGFLECSRFNLSTGSTRTVFCGQLIQVECAVPVPGFVLRPARPGLRHNRRLDPRGWVQAGQVSIAGRDWSLYMADPSSRAEVARRCALALAALPVPPRRVQLLGLVYANGWLQLICANRRDLFSLWQGILPASHPQAAVRRVMDHLTWAETSARALTRFATAAPDGPAI